MESKQPPTHAGAPPIYAYYAAATTAATRPPNNQIMLIGSNVRPILCQNPNVKSHQFISSKRGGRARRINLFDVERRRWRCSTGPTQPNISLDSVPRVTQRSKIPPPLLIHALFTHTNIFWCLMQNIRLDETQKKLKKIK